MLQPLNCQVLNSALLAPRHRTPRHWGLQMDIDADLALFCAERYALARASLLTLFAVRSADQFRRWRHSSADAFSRIEYSRDDYPGVPRQADRILVARHDI